MSLLRGQGRLRHVAEYISRPMAPAPAWVTSLVARPTVCPTARCRSSWSRPLDAGPYRFVQAHALTLRVREDGRTVLVHGLIAIGVNADGNREILGFVRSPAPRTELAGVLPRPGRARPCRGRAGHL